MQGGVLVQRFIDKIIRKQTNMFVPSLDTLLLRSVISTILGSLGFLRCYSPTTIVLLLLLLLLRSCVYPSYLL